VQLKCLYSVFILKFNFNNTNLKNSNYEIKHQFVQAETKEYSRCFSVRKLEQLARHYDWIIRADVKFKEEKSLMERQDMKLC
jgi:hypothetical protein